MKHCIDDPLEHNPLSIEEPVPGAFKVFVHSVKLKDDEVAKWLPKVPLKVLLSERKSERVSKLPVENLAMFPAALVFAEILLLQEEKPAMLMDEGPGFASFKFFLHYQKKIKKKCFTWKNPMFPLYFIIYWLGFTLMLW